MITLEITLSDDIAASAAKAGLFTRKRMERMLRAELAGQTQFEALLLEGLEGEATEWTAEDAERLRNLAATGR